MSSSCGLRVWKPANIALSTFNTNLLALKRRKAKPEAIALTRWGIEQLISGLKSQRLSHEQIHGLVETIRKGEDQNEIALRQLLKAMNPVIFMTAVESHIRKTNLLWESALQAGRAGVVSAIKDFDPKKAKFRTYAKTFIRNRIIDLIKAEFKHARCRARMASDNDGDALQLPSTDCAIEEAHKFFPVRLTSESAEHQVIRLEETEVMAAANDALCDLGFDATARDLKKGHDRAIEATIRLVPFLSLGAKYQRAKEAA